MEKVIVNDENIKYIVKYKYSQNNKVIDVSDLDTSKCTDISYLFNEMTKLEEIKGFNTLNLSNVRDMRCMCSDCQSLKELNLSGLDLSNVIYIACMYGGCYSLKELNLSGLDLYNVEDMSNMCSHCYSLKTLNLSGLNLHNVKDMSGMCANCKSLKELDLSGLDLHNVKDMSYICDGCDLLIDFKVDEQYQELFKHIINKVSARRNILSSVNLDMLRIPQHEETEVSPPTDTNTLENYKQQNIRDINELKQLQQHIAKLQAIIDKRTQLIQTFEEYEKLINT